eukprot:6464103-Amphidinium_carterae.1
MSTCSRAQSSAKQLHSKATAIQSASKTVFSPNPAKRETVPIPGDTVNPAFVHAMRHNKSGHESQNEHFLTPFPLGLSSLKHACIKWWHLMLRAVVSPGQDLMSKGPTNGGCSSHKSNRYPTCFYTKTTNNKI